MFTLPTIIFSLLIVIELLLWLPTKLQRQLMAASIVCLTVPVGIWFLASNGSGYALLAAVVLIYRSFNLWRLVAERRQPDHMFRVTRRASLWLAAAQASTVALMVANPVWTSTANIWLAGLTMGAAIILAAATQRNLAKTRPVADLERLPESQLPTVSVLVPARNETNDLTECLTSLVHSTYPKLEIIVLDDCSQNKRTPEIIKAFAHDGVRFIPGKVAPESWLAKNYAYQQLAEAASGDVLLYCGVDTRFKSGTIEQMVLTLLRKQKSMVSFIPANLTPPTTSITAMLVQPSRYAWELTLPRRSLHRPAVLSSAWLITKQTLQAAGSFAAFSRSVTPERHLARYAARHNDGYSILQSDTKSGVTSAKQFDEQQATAVRTRYPQLHQSLELTAATTMLELLVLVAPFVMYVSFWAQGQWVAFILADIACILIIAMYAQITNLTYRRFLLRSIWLAPFAALYDTALLNYSMYKYEFSDVQWKGRNVCIPVMQVIDRLPKV